MPAIGLGCQVFPELDPIFQGLHSFKSLARLTLKISSPDMDVLYGELAIDLRRGIRCICLATGVRNRLGGMANDAWWAFWSYMECNFCHPGKLCDCSGQLPELKLVVECSQTGKEMVNELLPGMFVSSDWNSESW